MNSLWLVRRSGVSLRATHARPCASLYCSTSVLSSALTPSCSRVASTTSSSSSSSLLRFSRPELVSIDKSGSHRNPISILPLTSRRFYSSRNYSRNNNDWKSTLKTGGLVLLGTGALIASTSLAFGFVIAGAAGFGVYTLYQRFWRPYRSNEPFHTMNSKINTSSDLLRPNRPREEVIGQDDLNSLLQGMPFVVRGFVKTVFSLAGRAMQHSMERAGELRRRTNEHLQRNKRVREQMGDDVSVDGPEQWIESTLNGVGRIEAVFPVNGTYSSARVTVKASIGKGDNLNLTELKYRNHETGDTIDLLRDSSVGGRKKTVIDAEFVDLDDENGRSRW
ncbi:unnamed protein product [Peronospora belbahrii]|uniref:Mitochondrial import inner membrane translocase subunit Tim21 n=1 Tax=Peronospora belbahrii TaxID=622444 RepID=A0ABN8D933_9STRA|nr:unnamed protein product [Peronospora belbahrii]